MLLEPFDIKIEIYSHFFAVFPKSVSARNAIYNFANRFVETEWKYDQQLRKNVQVVKSVWGGRLEDNTQFRYPISLLGEFKRKLLNFGVPLEKITEKVIPSYTPHPEAFSLDPKYKLRDYQEEGHQFADQRKAEGINSVLLQMPTGSGKTVTLLAYAVKLGLRMGMIVAPAHMESWIGYFQSYFGLPPEKTYVVRGGKAIVKLFALCRSGDYEYPTTLFSLRTLTEFFKAYEADPQACIDMYGGTPFELWSYTKIGFLGGDEVHENLEAVYWLQTFIHGPFHLGLSATMFHKDKFKSEMQNIIYPKAIRFDKIKMKKYIRQVNLGYRFEDIEKDHIRLSFPRRTTYSQNAFELSILKNRKVKTNVFKMLNVIFEEFWLNRKENGDKAGFYFSRIDFINEYLAHLKKSYPSLDIRRYVEQDPFENLMDSDVYITTIGSGGTGVDIAGLITVFNFDNVDSIQRNAQLLGRLREKEGKEMIFVQLYATNLKKHIGYKDSRDKLFEDRVLSRADVLYPGVV